MSRTDKTDPYRVKVREYGVYDDNYWLATYHCRCDYCKAGFSASKIERRRSKDLIRDWQRDYD
jgi:hypothetical protein